MLQEENIDHVRQTMSSAPKVSVIVPAYNVAAFIGETLDSIFAQTYSSYEVVVVNDGSPDSAELEQVLQPYREQIIYLQHENRGAAAARNTGLRAARGQYVAFLDGDDFWFPTYLQEQVNFLEDDQTHDLVFCDGLLFGDSRTEGRTFMEMGAAKLDATFLDLLSLRCSIIMSGVVARREKIFEVGLLDEQLRNSHDFDLWLRLARHGAKLAGHKKVLLHHRCRPDSLSGDSINRAERVKRVLNKVAGYDGLTAEEYVALTSSAKSVQAVLDLERGKYHFSHGAFAEALEHLHKANLVMRSWKLSAVIVFLQTAPRLLLKLHRQRGERAVMAAQ